MENKITETSTYRHYLPSSITMPEHQKPKILLIGAGGNGSPMLTGIARMNHAIMNLGNHPGFSLTVMDPDHVTASNVGRQLFSPSDVGRNKAECLVTRINGFFGVRFRALPFAFGMEHLKEIKSYGPSIIITAVDKYKPREIASIAAKETGAYWLDMGNGANSGQCILGTGRPVKQPTRIKHPCIPHLPTVIDLCPDLKKHADETKKAPSCSMHEALSKQDLFINTAISMYACSMLWDAIRQGYVNQHGVFINLKSKKTSPLPVNPQTWKQMGWNPLRGLSLERPRAQGHKRHDRAA